MKNLSGVLAALLMMSLTVPAIADDKTNKDKADTNAVKTHKHDVKKHSEKNHKKDSTKQPDTHKAGGFVGV